jgi:single-strand DNA-binding protein
VDTKNSVVLVGRLVAEPTLKYLDTGTAVATFSIAVNRSTRKPDGSFEDSLDGFFDCQVFGRLGQTAAETLHKGNEVQISGSLRQNKFKTRQGQTVSRVEITVRTIGQVLLPPRAAQNGEVPAAVQEMAAPDQAGVPQPA